jgi:hypothetical protein
MRRVEGDSVIRPAVGFFLQFVALPRTPRRSRRAPMAITVSSRSAAAHAPNPGPDKGLAAGVVRGTPSIEPDHVSEFVYRAIPCFRDSGRNLWLDRVHSAGVGSPPPATPAAGQWPGWPRVATDDYDQIAVACGITVPAERRFLLRPNSLVPNNMPPTVRRTGRPWLVNPQKM